MKSIYLLFIASLCPFLTVAQNFQKKITWKDNSFTSVNTDWVDINNDSLMDVLVSGENKSQNWQIKPYKNGVREFTPAPVMIYAISSGNYTFTDVNRDNRTDLVVSGSKANGTAVITSLINRENFQFTATEQNAPVSSPSKMKFADLNNDGRADLIISGNQSLKILGATLTGYEPKFDSTGLAVSDIAVLDFNNDGQLDVVISGNKNNTPVLFIMKNEGRFRFMKKQVANPQAGIIETGDINHDGRFDFIVSGTNKRSKRQINFYTNSEEEFQATDSIMDYPASQLFCADFNSDGFSDLYFGGKQTDGKRFNRIRKTDKTIISMDTTGVYSQRFGDYDRDGDLDILRVVDSASYFVFQIWENMSLPLNGNPSVPDQGFAISTPDRTFIYWGASTDDRTPQKALTYDLLLSAISGAEVVAPEFDLSSQKRKRPVHGYQTTNTFAIIKGLTDQRYTYTVQAVDNAFNGSKCGGGGGIMRCFDIQHDYVQACKDETVTLAAEAPAYWFSVSEGFLGIHSSYLFVASATDTLYSFVPAGTDCSKNKIWIIDVNEGSVSEKETVYACENSSLHLGIAPGWKNVIWKAGTETLSGDTIVIKVGGPQTITASASGGAGCAYQKEFQIKISKPVISLNGDAFTIAKGQQITLKASGAQNYLWQPSLGLSNEDVAEPVASPLSTIEYTVIASDSIGCKATGKVIVYVEEMAFIPNLFTPNGDGKNDELKIYGITSGSHFRFSIFNREGSVVYETKDIDQATRTGWNGTHAGIPQSSGLYYWKVEGSFGNGEAIKLNGKSSGSILLVK